MRLKYLSVVLKLCPGLAGWVALCVLLEVLTLTGLFLWGPTVFYHYCIPCLNCFCIQMISIVVTVVMVVVICFVITVHTVQPLCTYLLAHHISATLHYTHLLSLCFLSFLNTCYFLYFISWLIPKWLCYFIAWFLHELRKNYFIIMCLPFAFYEWQHE